MIEGIVLYSLGIVVISVFFLSLAYMLSIKFR